MELVLTRGRRGSKIPKIKLTSFVNCPYAPLTVISCHLDAGGCGEEAVPVLPAAHARPLVEVVRVVVVEGVVARGVGAVLRRALEATDPAVRGCKS